jgi:hypothetical protein
MPSLIMGLVLNFIVALLIGAALIGIDRRVPDFASRYRVVVIVAVAARPISTCSAPSITIRAGPISSTASSPTRRRSQPAG